MVYFNVGFKVVSLTVSFAAQFTRIISFPVNNWLVLFKFILSFKKLCCKWHNALEQWLQPYYQINIWNISGRVKQKTLLFYSKVLNASIFNLPIYIFSDLLNFFARCPFVSSLTAGCNCVCRCSVFLLTLYMCFLKFFAWYQFWLATPASSLLFPYLGLSRHLRRAVRPSHRWHQLA